MLCTKTGIRKEESVQWDKAKELLTRYRALLRESDDARQRYENALTEIRSWENGNGDTKPHRHRNQTCLVVEDTSEFPVSIK